MIRMKSGSTLVNGEVKNVLSEPFCTDAEIEERLVKLGIASFVSTKMPARAVATSAAVQTADSARATMPDTSAPPTGLEIVESGEAYHLGKEQLAEMSLADLKQLAKDMGIACGKLRSKADYIEAIAAEPVEIGEEAFPALDTEDIVV